MRSPKRKADQRAAADRLLEDWTCAISDDAGHDGNDEQKRGADDEGVEATGQAHRGSPSCLHDLQVAGQAAFLTIAETERFNLFMSSAAGGTVVRAATRVARQAAHPIDRA